MTPAPRSYRTRRYRAGGPALIGRWDIDAMTRLLASSLTCTLLSLCGRPTGSFPAPWSRSLHIFQLDAHSSSASDTADGARVTPFKSDTATTRRQASIIISSSTAGFLYTPSANGEYVSATRGSVLEARDPSSFSCCVYTPPTRRKSQGQSSTAETSETFPLLVVLHGAGNNNGDAMYEFTNEYPPGDHTNLPLFLCSTGKAPAQLRDEFVVVAPYAGKGKKSLYDEPRSKILSFIKWFNVWIEAQQFADGSQIAIDRSRVSLFGFSEGSTLAVELATTRQFNGVVCASYGFTGILPKEAVRRLQGIPLWIFHSEADDVYPIRCSTSIVNSLLEYEGATDIFDIGKNLKLTKLIPDKAAKSEPGFEHVRAALVASASNEVYSWLLSLP